MLLVEDTATNQLVARMMHAKLGHTVELADNGAIALAMMQARRFDVILMDCQMPVLDGYATSRQIRPGNLDGIDRNTPIVALTAHAMVGDEEKEDNVRLRRDKGMRWHWEVRLRFWTTKSYGSSKHSLVVASAICSRMSLKCSTETALPTLTR